MICANAVKSIAKFEFIFLGIKEVVLGFGFVLYIDFMTILFYNMTKITRRVLKSIDYFDFSSP